EESVGGSRARVARAFVAAGVLALVLALSGNAGHARDRLPGDVERLKMIGFTVADIDRVTVFFTKVLSFEKAADFRVAGSEYDKMEGVFNTNMRIVHLKLGEQMVELTQYISPSTGRPIPVPSYSNDEWFEHMAIVVRDMDAAYKILQDNNVQQISANPITIPESNPGAAGIKAVKFRDPGGLSHCAWKAAKRPVMVWKRSRIASRWSNPFLRRKSARLLETNSLRRKVENFSYCFRKACLK